MKQRRIRCLAAAAFVLLFLGAAWFTGCDLSLMWSRRDHLTDIAAKMFPPDWGFLGKVLPLLWATIQMSITGTFLGAVLSIPAAMACAAALPGPGPVKKAVRFCILPGPDPGPAGHILSGHRLLCRNGRHHGLHLCHHDPPDL